MYNSGDGKTVHLELVEWEQSVEGDSVAADDRVLDWLNNGQVLLVDVDDRKLLVVIIPGRRVVDSDAELQVLCLRCDVLGEDVKWLEDWQTDGVDVWASACDNEVLVESREGELTSACGEEWKSAGDLVLEAAVEAVLFAFLAND